MTNYISWGMMVDFIAAFFANAEARHAMLRAAREKFPDGASAYDFGEWLSENMP